MRSTRGSGGSMDALLEVRDLRVHFSGDGGIARAVDGASFSIGRGETLGLVGESGSGKTTVARAIVRLEEPTSGEIIFDGLPLHALRGKALRRIRPRIQIVFQDPYASLNPRRVVSDLIGEALVVHGRARRRELDARVAGILARVGLPAASLDRYPHEFSGGERQRISIARAIALEPELLVCDEPVSSLDVSIQAQVIDLLLRLQEELRIACLFIAHDLAVVRQISHRVAVMYLGRIVEEARCDALFRDPRHPYTRALLASIPALDPDARREHPALAGDIPSPLAPPPGCRFHPRCPEALPICREVEPAVRDHGGGHRSACHAS